MSLAGARGFKRKAGVGTTPTPRCTPPGIFFGILLSFAGWDGVRYAGDRWPGEEPSPEEEGARIYWQKVAPPIPGGLGPRKGAVVLGKWNKVYKKTGPNSGEILLLIEKLHANNQDDMR